jgi:HEAT repeat protein
MLAAALTMALLPRTSAVPDARSVYRKVQAAVVKVRAGDAVGTGFAVGDGTLVVTCFHVVEDSPRAVTIAGRPATVIASNSTTDVAVLAVKKAIPSALRMAAARPAPGSKVFVVGNPLGTLDKSISEGIVSGSRQAGDVDYIQITAPISEGSSGSPVTDERGMVVGMAALTLESGQALNFAIATPVLKRTLATAQAMQAKLAHPTFEGAWARRNLVLRATPTGSGRRIATRKAGARLEVRPMPNRRWMAVLLPDRKIAYAPADGITFEPPPAAVRELEEYVGQLTRRVVAIACEPDSERSFKARAILRNAGREAVPFLLEVLSKDDAPPDAVRVLARFGEEAKPAILNALANGNSSLKLRAAASLAYMATYLAAAERGSAVDPEQSDLAQVKRKYGFLRGEDVVRGLRKALDSRADHAGLAATTVGILGVQDIAALVILRDMTEEPNLELAQDAFGALARLYPARRVDDLRKAFDAIYAAIYDLELKDEALGTKIADFVERLEVADSAVVAELLRDLLDHDDVYVRVYVCRTIENLQDPAFLPDVERLLDDRDEDVRFAALATAGLLGKGKHLARMIAGTTSPNPAARYWSVRAIANTEDAAGLPALLPLVRDPDRSVRTVLVEALGVLGGEEARKALEKLAADPEPEIRKSAKEALAELAKG